MKTKSLLNNKIFSENTDSYEYELRLCYRLEEILRI